MRYLKQSTAATLQVGPFVDAADGVTPEEALTPAFDLAKGGGSFAARSASASPEHDEDGWYQVELDETDTSTLGELILKSQHEDHLPVVHHYTVLAAQVYDALVAGTDLLQIDVAELYGSGPSAEKAMAFFRGMTLGTFEGSPGTTQSETSLSEPTDDHYNGKYLYVLDGVCAGQLSQVSDYIGASKELVYAELTDTPQAGDGFVLF
ncbi:MAG: hypothetical protein KIS85_06275 [Anaerolineales bacterium]|nr:hypothetical protein [Anaerolineales bacterium]